MAKKRMAYWLSVALRIFLVLKTFSCLVLLAQGGSPPDLDPFDKLEKYIIFDKGSISSERALRLGSDFDELGIRATYKYYEGSKVTKLEDVLSMVKVSKNMSSPIVVVIVSDFVQEEIDCDAVADAGKDGCYEFGKKKLMERLENVDVKKDVIALLLEAFEGARKDVVDKHSSRDVINNKFEHGDVSSDVGAGVALLKSMYDKYRKGYREKYDVKLDLVESAVLCRGMICLKMKGAVNVNSVLCEGVPVKGEIYTAAKDNVRLVYFKHDTVVPGKDVTVSVITDEGKSIARPLKVVDDLVDVTYLENPNLSQSVYFEAVFSKNSRDCVEIHLAQNKWVKLHVTDNKAYINTAEFKDPENVLLYGDRSDVGNYVCELKENPVLNRAVGFVRNSAYVVFLIVLVLGWRSSGDNWETRSHFVVTIQGLGQVVVPFLSIVTETVMWWKIAVDSPEAVIFRSISISFVVASMIIAVALLFAQKVARKSFENQMTAKYDVIEWSKIVAIRWVLIVGIIAFIVFSVCWWLLIR